MAVLGLSPEIIIRSINESYLSTLPIDEANAFVEDLLSDTANAIQEQIDDLELRMDEVTTGANNIASSATSWTVSIATADPMAGIASAGVIASTVGSVKAAKGQLLTFSVSLAIVTSTINRWGISLPPAVTTASNAISIATAALAALPV